MVSSINKESEADSLERYYLEEATEPTHDSKLVIKLRMPKSDDSLIEDGETVSSKAKKEHYCIDCDKSFSSGKALGGHMSSAHVQAGRGYQSKKFRVKNSTKLKQRGSGHDPEEENELGADGEKKKILCGICGKDFPTRKSLYGHMRCHPDRDYRGMNPPESNKKIGQFPSLLDEEAVKKSREFPSLLELDEEAVKKSGQSSPSEDHVYKLPLEEEIKEDSSPCSGSTSSTSSDKDNEASVDTHHHYHPPVDLTRFLSRWAVTGQRGRQGNNLDIKSSSSHLPPAEVEELSDAAYSLVGLSNGTHPRNDMFDEEDDRYSNSMTPDAEIDHRKNMQKKEANNTKDFSIKMGEKKSKSNFKSVADYYEDVKRVSKSKRLSTHGRQFSPVKKLIIGERKPERQILQPAASCVGKGKAPMDDMIYESGEDHDSDSEKTLEQQNKDYVVYWKKNGYKKNRFDFEGKKEKAWNNIEANLMSPVSEKKDATITAEVSSPEKYKCSTCNKGFSTHQALGGHRSSHNKLRVCIQNTVDDSSPENQYNCINSQSQIMEAKEIGKPPGLMIKLVHENPAHRCQICTKSFSSGQALGGHMRCHANGQTASPEEDINHSVRKVLRKVLTFDLNELPDMEEAASKDHSSTH